MKGSAFVLYLGPSSTEGVVRPRGNSSGLELFEEMLSTMTHDPELGPEWP